MTKEPNKHWRKKRQPKWRDMYVKVRMSPSWKKFRKHQAWRLRDGGKR